MKTMQTKTRQTADYYVDGLDHGVYAVKGYVELLDEYYDVDDLAYLLNWALKGSRGDLKEAASLIAGGDNRGDENIDEYKEVCGAHALKTLRDASKVVTSSPQVATMSSYNTSGDATYVIFLGKWKRLARTGSPMDFFAALSKMGNLLSGTKLFDASRDGNFAMWQRAKDEFIVYASDNY